MPARCWNGAAVEYAVDDRRRRLHGTALCWLGSSLAVSGVVGLTVGDFCYCYALATIGPRVASVVMLLWPGCAVAFEQLRGQSLTPGERLGVSMTVGGVVLALLRRGADASDRGGGWRGDLSRREWLLGILGAYGGALGQAFVFLVSGDATASVADPAGGPDLAVEIDPLLATIVRRVAATIGMQVVVTLQGRPFAMGKLVRHRRAHAIAWIGSICGPVLGVWRMMVARARAEHSGVAAALMARTPVIFCLCRPGSTVLALACSESSARCRPWRATSFA